ncbi:MAG: tRNA (N(6)-L-threonylcarbamoyladenosine(37)-C(2))-methylthiotransferase MtaB [Bacteroidales bacterium]|nr:tRNA (N(6)-L-threonylcarbamoyladenosine(37)-C(2))-methylthiotransferase MtaB [Bacteroidales bacterium]
MGRSIKRKAAFKTLGCRLNQFETDALVTDFTRAGYEVVDFGSPADVYVINTCTVTNQSDKKSKNIINQAVKAAPGQALVLVTGCMVSNQKEYLESRGDIDYVVDNKRKSSILPLMEAHFKGEIVSPSGYEKNLFNFSVVEDGFHTRSAIKIQDGCDNFCTYCIVPKVRGRATSRPPEDILENIRKSLALGNREMVLTGVNISRYEYEGMKFDDLIEKILELPGDFRVRISSIEPEGFTEKLLRLFENPKLCPHLHLCLQSGSDSVLKRMRRFYTRQQFEDIVQTYRTAYPAFNFTTDIIVGFPGETREEFQDTLKVAEQVGFSHIHTFKYSKRDGTNAIAFPDQLAEKVKKERSEAVRDLAEKNKLSYRKQFIGKEQRLLVERSNSRGGSRGYGEHYLPIIVRDGKLTKNAFYRVRITGILDDKEKTMTAELI